jgi:hypothetical protein
MKKYIASVEVPDDWVPKHEPYSVDFFFEQDIMSTQMIEGDGWKSLDEIPKEGDYILISFANYSLPDIGRYEDGVFYPGDEEKSYKEYGLIVNGWRPLPRCKEG